MTQLYDENLTANNVSSFPTPHIEEEGDHTYNYQGILKTKDETEGSALVGLQPSSDFKLHKRDKRQELSLQIDCHKNHTRQT